MPEKRELTAFACVFTVSDVAAALTFYLEQLGFREQFRLGEPIPYAIVERGKVSIHLEGYGRDKAAVGKSHIYIFTGDVNALRDEFIGRDTTIVHDPEDFPYGMREMELRDPDGNRITFGQNLRG
jgi:catechol 2,3-dioxygenase-like lactoylglutathione lyase family enzyme